jgi:hypothetical protein
LAIPEKYQAHLQRFHDYKARNRDKIIARYRVRTYGEGVLEWYVEQWARQSGRCAFCSRHESEVSTPRFPSLVIDHDPGTKRWRRLLCHNCNAAYGLFSENTETLKRVLDAAKEDASCRSAKDITIEVNHTKIAYADGVSIEYGTLAILGGYNRPEQHPTILLHETNGFPHRSVTPGQKVQLADGMRFTVINTGSA